MQGWIEGFQKSIDFMEQNMTEELDTADIAAQAARAPLKNEGNQIVCIL